MSCKSALYAANTTAQTFTASGPINFGSIVRRYGCNCNLSGGTNVIVNGPGYYDIDTCFSITGAAATAATVTISLYIDSVAIPGASGSVTVTNAETQSVSIPAIVRQRCGCLEGVVTAVIDGAAVVNSAAIAIEKV